MSGSDTALFLWRALKMQLWKYQADAVDSVFAWWAAGRIHEDPLIIMPTGSGKTIVFSTLIKRLLTSYHDVSILVLAHRQKLISQAEQKLLTVWPDAPVGIYAASLKRREIRKITIASRDSIVHALDDIGQFTFVIIDEAHRISTQANTGQYQKLISALRKRYRHLVVIGFTATPFRADYYQDQDALSGKKTQKRTKLIYGEGKLFAGVCYQAHVLDLIQCGYLSVIKSIKPETGQINTDNLKVTTGDFNESELEKHAMECGLIQAQVEEWILNAYARGRKSSVFFCVSIVHAQEVTEVLKQQAIDARIVHGKMKQHEHTEVLTAFDRGEFPALVSVEMLIEGWDCPRVDCVVLLRATRSLVFYHQMVGRGLRLFHCKQDCFVMDFGGNIERHGPIDRADPEKTKVCKKCLARILIEYRECPVCGAVQYEEKPAIEEPPPHDPKEGGSLGVSKPQYGGIISTELVPAKPTTPQYETYDVVDVGYQIATSMNTGSQYLRLYYYSSDYTRFSENLMIGYDGYAGVKALKKWQQLTVSNELPNTARQAIEMLDNGIVALRTPTQITVDLSTKYRNILQFYFESSPSEREAA